MPDLSQLSDEEILRNLPDEIILQQAGLQPQTQLSPARKIINSIFTPSNVVREGVSGIISSQLQSAQDLLGATGIGQLTKATTPEPFRVMAALVPRQIGQIAGTAASLPFDPTTYALGGSLSIPNRIARMVASGVVGATSPAVQSYGRTGDVLSDPLSIALGGTLGTVGGALAKINPRVVSGEGSPIEYQGMPGKGIVNFLKGNPDAIQSAKANMEAALQQSAKQLDSDAYDVVTSYRRGGANHQDFFTRHGQLSDEAFAPVKQVGKAVIQPTPVDELKASIAAHYSDDPTFTQKAGLTLDQMYEGAPQGGLTGESLISKSTELGENVRSAVNKGMMPRNAGEQLIASIRAAIGQAIEARAPEELKGMYQTGMNQWAEHAADTRRLFRLLKPGAAQAEPTAEGVNFIKKAVTGGFDTDTDTQNFMSRVQSRYGINLPNAIIRAGEQVQQAQEALQQAQQVGQRGVFIRKEVLPRILELVGLTGLYGAIRKR